MDAWQLLGLEPTHDTKAIRKSYAVLLKLNKPDENPEGFSQLHSAYKYCLQQARHISPAEPTSNTETPVLADSATKHEEAALPVTDNQSATASSSSVSSTPAQPITETPVPISVPVPEIEPVLSHHDTDQANVNEETPEAESPITIHDPLLSADVAEVPPPTEEELAQERYEQELENAKAYLMQCTEQALEAMLSNDDIGAWQFIDQCDALYDIDLKAGYCDYLLGQWLNFFSNNPKINPQKKQQSLFFLNEQFNWLGQVRDFEEEYGYEAIAPIFDVLQKTEGITERKLKWVVDPRHRGPIEIAGYYQRLAATLIDGLIFLMIFTSLPHGWSSGEMLIHGAILFIAMKAIFEASPMQGSPGMVLFGMKVTTKKGRRLNILHALWRQLTFSASTAAFKITVWINFFLSGGRLIHDLASGSSVIKR